MLGETHVCSACSALVNCAVPGWLCAWNNHDDDTFCGSCAEAAYARREAPVDAPLHFLMHTARTGGKTLRWIAARQYWKRFELFAFRKHHAPDAVALLPPGERARLRMIQDVSRYGVHEQVGRPGRYLAMLRHPVGRVVSYHFYKGGADGRVFKILGHMRDNGQTRSLAGMEPYTTDPAPVTSAIFERARHNMLAHCDWIGITERFDESLVLARRRLGWTRILHQPRNVSRRRTAFELPPAAIRQIEDDNQFDLQLFEFAQRQLTDAIAAEGPSFAVQLEAFQRLNAVERREIRVGEQFASPSPDVYRRAIPDVVAAFRRDHAAVPDGPIDSAFRTFVTELCAHSERNATVGSIAAARRAGI